MTRVMLPPHEDRARNLTDGGRHQTPLGRAFGIMKAVPRSLVPSMEDITDGPPVARIMPFSAAVLSIFLCAALFLNLPTASALTLPLFALPVPLLASRRTYLVVLAYTLLALGCAGKAVAAVLAANLTAGQVLSGIAVWGWMSFNFVVSARMIQSRGVRFDDS